MFFATKKYWDFFHNTETTFNAAIQILGLSPCKFEACGSLARGELQPPFSDLDLLIIASEGDGGRVRDEIPRFATTLGNLLTIFADPLSSESTFCSIYSGPLKVDWFVAEDKKEYPKDTITKRTMIWKGTAPSPYEWESHPWDWLWWLWCKLNNKKCGLVSCELTKLWQFLRLHDIDVEEFPSSIPNEADSARLRELLLATLDILPRANFRLSKEISDAMTTKLI